MSQTEYTVIGGDTLGAIARAKLGSAARYVEITLKTAATGHLPTFAERVAAGQASSDGVAYIFAGDILLIPVDAKDDAAGNAVKTEPPKAEPPETKTTSSSEGYHHQAPFPRIEIYKPDDPSQPYMVYDGEAQGAYRQLLRYQFTEDTGDVRGSFSFAVENETIGGKTTIDRIKTRSVVKIFEGGDKPVFIGIIRRGAISAAMGSQGPQKNITFSGTSILGIIADFILSLDIKIMDISDAAAASTQLTTDLITAKTIADFLKITGNAYIGLTIENYKMSESETVNMAKDFIDPGLNMFTYGENDSDFSYNIANCIFNQGQNSLVEMWKNILPNPVYEIYGYCDRAGKPGIMARESPFDKDTWRLLQATKVNPVSLKGYNLARSDEEVYTVFNTWLEGSAMGHDFYTVVNQYKGKDSAVVIDDDKLSIYGYRPLEVAFRGYDRSENIKDKSQDLTQKFKTLNERVKLWYSRLDDMWNGTVTLTTNFNEPDSNPRIGERLLFLDGEFYIKKSDHAWAYGGTPTNTLAVSRGMIYNDGEMIKGDAGVLQHIGNEMREIEA